MTTIICITAVARRSKWRPRRRLLTIVATTIFCGVVAPKNGAEQVDSGWALSAPSPLSTSKATVNHEQQLMFRNVLEETRRPLVTRKSSAESAAPQHGANPAANSTGASPAAPHEAVASNSRLAVKPDGIDGWRSAAQTSTAAELNVSPGAAPILVAPMAVKAAEVVPENDCGQAPAKSAAPNGPWRPGLGESPVVGDEADTETVVTDEEASAAEEQGSAIADAAEASDITPQIDLKKGELVTESSEPVEPQVNLPPPLTRQLTNLRTRVRSVLKGYYRRQLNSRDNDPWEVMHGMLAYGVQSRIRQGGPRGQPITSVGWLCYNKPCKGQTLMYVTPAGELRAKYGVGLQGHLGQLLAMLAQCRVSADYPIRIGNREFTIHDLIEAEKKTCYPKSELTFKLLALQYYADLNDKWVNDQGVDWDFPRLVREELAQPIRGAACGGTHRLSSLSLTVKARIRRGESLNGEYARAAEFVKKYHQYAFRLQNRDGSLSTSWFRGRGDESDINRRIKTTGHILEWLCYSLSDEEMREPRTINAVTYLANLMYSNYDNEWEVGPICHATHALLLYDERVFRPHDKPGTMAIYRAAPSSKVARRYQSETLRR